MNQKALNEVSISREFVAPVPVCANDGPWSLRQFREDVDALCGWRRRSSQTDKCGRVVENPEYSVVGRAAANHLIVNRKLGLNFCESPWQGSFVVDALTDLVEEAVCKEFEAISVRGGVLGAMDTMCPRGKIQEESLYCEQKKHDGSLPLIGVNTYLPKDDGGEIATTIELIRSTEVEKNQQIGNVRVYQEARNALSLGESESSSLGALKVLSRLPGRGEICLRG